MDTVFRLCRTGMMTIAWMMVLPCLFILFGATVPIIPWFRIYAVNVLPNHTFVVLPMVDRGVADRPARQFAAPDERRRSA